MPEAPTQSVERASDLGGRIAELLVAFGAALMVLGSAFRWAVFDGFLGLAETSGIELGPGIVTLLIGALLGLIGLAAVRTGGVSRLRRPAMTLAVGGLAIVVLTYAVLAIPVVELEYGSFVGPEEGLLLVGLGAAVAGIAASRLKAA